ncbi:MAG: S26 family signal peptidase [Desulfobacterales bacterium]|nr:S26 family signal peptidase [Desulfobacterales bacterium]
MNLDLDKLPSTQAQRSSSETLLRRSALHSNANGVWLDESKMFPELISNLLTDGHQIKFRAPGDSMYPTIRNGDIIIVKPIKTGAITPGDILLYRHQSGVAAHRVIRICKRSEDHSRSAPKNSQNCSSSARLYFILRGDAAVVFDRAVTADQILGKVTAVDRDGLGIDPYSLKATICFKARRMAARLKRSVLFQS